MAFLDVNIDEEPDAEELVLQVNEGRRKVPTIKVGDRFLTNGIDISHLLLFSKPNPNWQPISQRRLAEGSNSALSQ